MKKHKKRTLRILIDAGTLSPSDIRDIEQWENEGGKAASMPEFLDSLSPVRPGEILEIASGDIHYEDGKLYYEAEINILALP